MQSTLNTPVSFPVGDRLNHTTDWRLGIPLYVYAVVFSSLCIVWGLLWDIMWHMSIGRDGLFAPPHLLMYVGAVVAGLFSGFKILQLTFQKSHPDRAVSVRFWSVFYGSLGALYCVWGALAMLTSAPFDDWWHNTYGLDVQILTPPHTILLLGMMIVQFGSIISVLALQNRLGDRAPETELEKRQTSRIRLMFGISAGLLLSVLFILFSENMGEWASHNSSYYTWAAIAFPVYLMAVGRASPLRNGLTIITAVYMLTMLIPSWILPLFPATPKLGPVLNPITHYQAFIFPLVLVVPGFLLDKLMQRYSGKLNDWALAALAAGVFMLTLLLIQWPVGEFLHTSPYARNWFFLAESWNYADDPNWEYRYKFHPYFTQTAGQFALGFAKAMLIAFVSARIGLYWGNWMKRVQR